MAFLLEGDYMGNKENIRIPVFNHIIESECCGCEACANVCPLKIIKFVQDREGFRYPFVDAEECINCKQCVNVCPAINYNENENIKFMSKSGYIKDENILLSSSSGGFFSVLVNTFKKIYKDGYISGVVWDEEYNYVYHVLDKGNRINDMVGSKYIQSRKNFIYNEIKEKLENGGAVLFVGTGCEVVALKNVLKKDYEKLFTIDLICKGPCCEKAFVEYINKIKNKYKSKIKKINMRYIGWKTWIPQWIKIDFENKKSYKKIFYTTDFGRAFYLMQRKSCSNCHYSGNKRKSDITIGDFHGADKNKSYYNPKGVSVMIANNKKGLQLVEHIDYKNVVLEDVDYETIAMHNPCLIAPVKANEKREEFCDLFISKGLEVAVKNTYPFKEKMVNHLPPEMAEKLYRGFNIIRGKKK